MAKSKKKQQFTIYETRTQLSALLKRVRAGEEIYIAHGKEPVAKLVPLQPAQHPRKAGSARGQFVMSADFDAPIPDALLSLFYK